MAANRAGFGLGAEMEEQTRSHVFVFIDVLVFDKLVVLDALPNAVMVRVHLGKIKG
jgi:hypothetical protein